MTEKELLEKIRAAAVEKDGKPRLACDAAYRLAAESGEPLQRIGKLCDTHDIKICNCQLGCF